MVELKKTKVDQSREHIHDLIEQAAKHIAKVKLESSIHAQFD
jgi:hypothetical protein